MRVIISERKSILDTADAETVFLQIKDKNRYQKKQKISGQERADKILCLSKFFIFNLT